MKTKWLILLVLVLIPLWMAGCGNSDNPAIQPIVDDNPPQEPVPSGEPLLPVLFIHGTSGSASQFESQAQRFLANGYPKNYLGVFEYNTAPFAAAASDVAAFSALLYDPDFQARINAAVDRLLADSGQTKVNLIGHSLGTFVSNAFLKTGANAQRIAHYVNVDGTNGQGTGTPFGGVETLALWGMGNDDKTALGDTATDDHDNTQAHIEVCTSATSFAKIYQFFNDDAPATTAIPEKEGATVMIAGKAHIFPENVGAENNILTIYEVNPDTGSRLSGTPIDAGWAIDADGAWGPVEVKKGASYEFVLVHDTAEGATHIFYREPFYADNYFIRLNTSRPGEGLSSQLAHSENHTLLMIARDKEMWGDQGDGNDALLVNGDQVLTKDAAEQRRRLSSIFLCDADESLDSSFETLAAITQQSFIAGIDFYIEAASPPDQPVTIELTSRGSGGVKQTINVPNWPSSEVRTVSVQFRDFVQ